MDTLASHTGYNVRSDWVLGVPSPAALTRPGFGRFRYEFPGVGSVSVHCYRPRRFGSDSPSLFVMHGTKRNADDYRATWAPAAERYGCLLLCPEFPRRSYPGLAYSRGGVVDRSGVSRPRQEWTFAAVEGLFDHVRDVTDNASDAYFLYGHSAGAQFVHRLALLVPEARYVAAVAANAGWYTMPTFHETFPYGLEGIEVTTEALRGALARRLIVMLGESDVEADDPLLRNSSRARRQGRNRLERGHAFHAAALEQARRLGVELNWKLITVPRAAHSDPEMMPAAAEALFASR